MISSILRPRQVEKTHTARNTSTHAKRSTVNSAHAAKMPDLFWDVLFTVLFSVFFDL